MSILPMPANAAERSLCSGANTSTQSTPLALNGVFCKLFRFMQTRSDGGRSLRLQTEVAVKPSRPEVPSEVMMFTDVPSLAIPSRNVCNETSGVSIAVSTGTRGLNRPLLGSTSLNPVSACKCTGDVHVGQSRDDALRMREAVVVGVRRPLIFSCGIDDHLSDVRERLEE